MAEKKTLLIIILLSVLLVGILAGSFALSALLSDNSEGMSIRFIDVGKGDAILVTVNGESMLVDAGFEETAKETASLILESGVSRLRAAVLTHFDKDHIGGAEYILGKIPSDTVYVPPYRGDSVYYDNLSLMLMLRGKTLTEIRSGFRFTLGGENAASVTALAPVGDSYSGDNDWSVVLMIEYGGKKVLLTGDIEEAAASDILKEHGSGLKADLLKVPHHGKKGSLSSEFLEAVSPSCAVISTGPDGDEELPHSSVTALLEEKGVSVYRTDLSGNITVEISPEGELSVSAEK